ncbi:tripartite tricarboxylate transporter substrate binding protein [Halobacillus amylolyticus]|uniref:Tripartite tricarboxylate transporter substrate binding protein n=1 Tax=Halobacillus amylolyticus TaxID=2932259 RepID=A0ABY4HFL8_9BACI|nr:tripartite tricarboxylate transporter substrate binding protein [Halobacillus amylolyticus]UOR13544.1 tripartite tricarboxylate transporter substrate binding protein [Halobacillus amylolyticus]
MRKFGMIPILLLLLLMAACSGNASGSQEYPTNNIEIVAPASPGGGWDLTARSLENVLSGQDLVENNINVVNKPGGGGEVGWQYLKSKDSHSLAVNSSLVLTNNLLGQSKLTYEDFTPIATLATEWQALAVPADSEFNTATEFLEATKADPGSIKIGVGPGLGNDDHLSLVQAASEFGINPSELNFLVYEGGGDVVTALLGGHVNAVTTSLSEVKDQHLAGKLKILAVSSEKPVKGIEDVPTWKEAGVDMVFPHWRGLMGPPDMTDEEIAYWDDKLSKMVETEAWQEVLNNNDWEGFYKNSEETEAFLKEQHDLYQKLVKDSGLVN